MFDSPYFLFIFLAVGILLFFVLRSIEKNLQQNIDKSKSLVDDFFCVFVLSLMPWVYISILLLAGSYTLSLVTGGWATIRDAVVLILGTYQGAVTLTAIGNFIISHTKVSRKRERKLLHVFSRLLSLLVWIIGILFLLSNFGINITALLAGFGIGGVAIAFAFQNILKDLFSYFTILLDEPIREGDIVHVAGQEGTVKHIGIKTTRLTATGGEEIVIANDTIASSELKNYGTAKRRRISFSLFLEHDNTQTKLSKLPDQFIDLVNNIEGLEHKSTYIKSITAAGIELTTIYFVKNRDFELHRNTRTGLYLAIHKLFVKEKIKLAQADIVANQ